MKKIYSSLLYGGVLFSLMSNNVYAIRALYPGETDWRAKTDAVYSWINIVKILVTAYVIFLIILFIKSNKLLKQKLKKYGILLLIGIVIFVLIFFCGCYLISGTDLYKLFL